MKTNIDQKIFQVLNSVPGFVFWKDNGLKYCGANKEFLKLTGLESINDLIGKQDQELPWSSEYINYFKKYDKEVLLLDNTISAIHGDILIQDSQGVFTITTNKFPIHDDEGNVVGVLGLSSEVRSQELNNQIYLENIIERIPYYIFWKNTASVYLGCNQRFADLVGKKSPKEIIGKTDVELEWGKGEPELYRQGDLETMQGNPKINVEEVLARPDGSNIVMLVSKIPLRDKFNNCIGVLGISTDITERKKAEQQLRIEKEKAEAANKAKSDFLAVVSHELRTPLTGILGIVEMLLRGGDELPAQSQKTNLGKIDTASKHLLALINNILDFAKLNENKFKLVQIPFSLEEDVFQKVLDILQAKAFEKDLSLTIRYPEEMPRYFLGDPKALLQVFINVIGNAIKFTEKGGITISVEQTSITQTDIALRILIKDTGIGIPAGKLEKIFERFEQVNSSEKRTYGGTGLGLSVSQKLLDLMGGKISVVSNEGEGSIFFVDITLVLSSAEAQKPRLFSEVEGIIMAKGDLRILLVEDDPLIQFVHQHKFEQLGYKVDIANNGAEAIRLFEANKYNIAFVDIGLPDMSGNEVMQIIRQKKGEKSRLPLVALTAYVDEQNRKRARESGANYVLSKPIDDIKLAAVLEKTLG
jgi:PAS domain S-box-containing protein